MNAGSWRWRRLPLGLAWLAIAPAVAADSASPQPLNLKDLAAYQAALEPTSAKAMAVGFRDLWTRPEAYRGKRVRVEGRLARRFRQGKMGKFPPLVENWVVNKAGDPFCLVSPDSSTSRPNEPKLGDMVAFEGTLLRMIAYQGGDAQRLVPLIVGGETLNRTERGTTGASGGGMALFNGWSLDWPLGLGAAALVALLLGRQHLRRPLTRSSIRPGDSPAPEFLDQDVMAKNAGWDRKRWTADGPSADDQGWQSESEAESDGTRGHERR